MAINIIKSFSFGLKNYAGNFPILVNGGINCSTNGLGSTNEDKTSFGYLSKISTEKVESSSILCSDFFPWENNQTLIFSPIIIEPDIDFTMPESERPISPVPKKRDMCIRGYCYTYDFEMDYYRLDDVYSISTIDEIIERTESHYNFTQETLQSVRNQNGITDPHKLFLMVEWKAYFWRYSDYVPGEHRYHSRVGGLEQSIGEVIEIRYKYN